MYMFLLFYCLANVEGMFLGKLGEDSPGTQVLLFQLVGLDEPLADAHKVLVHEAPRNSREGGIKSKGEVMLSKLLC